ncbi:MAG: CAP domain-containing protein [Chloroflexota bacterium]
MNRVIFFLFAFLTLPFINLIFSWNGTDSVVKAQSFQSGDQLLDAEFVAYYTNLQRRAHGLAPLKMSKELTEASLLFAEDAIVNLGGSYCGHTDSLNRGIGERLHYVGMNGAQAWAENVACGQVTSSAAVDMWMNSDGHRANILNGTYTEIGVGNFFLEDKGYIVQDFAFDSSISPLIINNEAPSTTSDDVSLYLYDHFVRAGLTGIGPAVEMMIANSPDFAGATWEPFTQEKSWKLEAGTGWRTVYAMTKDADGRRLFRSDRIYLGDAPVLDQTLDFYPSVRTNLTRAMITSQLPQADGAHAVQISLDWEICESDANMQVAFGNVETVSDASARGGQAQEMSASRQDAYTIVWSQEHIPGLEMIAYVRLKVDNNQATDEIIHLDVRGDGTVYGNLALRGTDFTETNGYQEFPIRFTVPTDYKPALLEVHIRKASPQTVFFDGVSFYTDSILFTEDFNWSTARPAHRSRGVLVRTVQDDGAVSDPFHIAPVVVGAESIVPTTPSPTPVPPTATPTPTPDAPTPTPEPTSTPGATLNYETVSLETVKDGQVTFGDLVEVNCSNCAQRWTISSSAAWLEGAPINGAQVEVRANAVGLPVGEHTAHLVVTPHNATSAEASARLTVTLTVQEEPTGTSLQAIFLPLALN